MTPLKAQFLCVCVLVTERCDFCFLCNWEYPFVKGNLTKHMKSKAHGKKCLEMSMSESSVDELESEEAGRVAKKSFCGLMNIRGLNDDM